MNSNDDQPIGANTTTLDMLYVQHPWLREMHEAMDRESKELWDDVVEMRNTISRLRERNHNQRQELKRLNMAHLRKNARTVNLEASEAMHAKELRDMTVVVHAILTGQIEVVRPGKVGPDLMMTMLADLAAEVAPGNSPQ